MLLLLLLLLPIIYPTPPTKTGCTKRASVATDTTLCSDCIFQAFGIAGKWRSDVGNKLRAKFLFVWLLFFFLCWMDIYLHELFLFNIDLGWLIGYLDITLLQYILAQTFYFNEAYHYAKV